MMSDRITPTWDVIVCALKSLFSKYDIDLGAIGQGQRLEYSGFETILYHLFTIIDAAECRRKFWSIYPARDPDERSKFITNAALFINGKQLVPNRVSASQLRMFGGEPFRRIMTSLILKAVELETATIMKRLAAEDEQYQSPELGLAEYNEEIDKAREVLRTKSIELSEASQNFCHLEQSQVDLEQEIQDKYYSLIELDESPSDLAVSSIEDRKKKIFKSLLSKLESSMRNRESAKRKIASVPSTKLINSNPVTPSVKHDKRISEYFVDLRRCLLESPQNSPDANQSRLINNISQRLVEYETGVEEIRVSLEREKEKADEALLEDPEMQERYRFFEDLIPRVDIKSFLGSSRENLENSPRGEIDMSEVCEILSKYPDSRYDDEEILDHFAKNILRLGC